VEAERSAEGIPSLLAKAEELPVPSCPQSGAEARDDLSQ
jgi:hypothetical protein